MYNEKPIPVYHSKDELEPKQIYISTVGICSSPFDKLIEEYKQQLNLTENQTCPRGLRAKLPLYNDVMTQDGLMLMTNEEIEKIVDKFNSIGCMSFLIPSEQINQLIEQFEKENDQC